MTQPAYPVLFSGVKPLRCGDLPEEAFLNPFAGLADPIFRALAADASLMRPTPEQQKGPPPKDGPVPSSA